MRALVFVVVLGLCSPLLQAKVFDRCSLARELDKRGVSRGDLPDWVCIAQWESSFRTYRTNKNTNGSTDWGLFQINDRWWCDPKNGGRTHNVCKVNCSELITDDITAALKCALTVKRQQGYKAWVAWNNKCQGKKPSVADCF